MTDDEEHRFMRLLELMHEELAQMKQALRDVCTSRADELQRIISLESWRARAERGDVEIREMNREQLAMLNAQNAAFERAEAKRDGAREEAAKAREEALKLRDEAAKALERKIKIWISLVMAVFTAVGWVVSHFGWLISR